MDATTLLGTTLARLLDAAARLAVSTSGWPSPAGLVEGSLTTGARVLLLAAVLAWVAGILAVLVVVSDRGAAGAPAARSPRPAPPLPPRRVRAAVPEEVPIRVLVPTPAPVEVETLPAVATAVPVAPAVPAPVVPGVTVVRDVPAAQEDAAPASEPQRRAPLVGHPYRTARTATTAPRCRRCTQPRCWPSTGQRHPARVLGASAPRACRTSLTAGTSHRCGAADPWCGSDRCTTPARAHPARPAPGSERTPALPR